MRKVQCLLYLLIIAVSQIDCPEAYGQDAVEIYGPDVPIPQRYESWSLFLVCNPAWLRANENENLLELWWNFNSFGRVIGRNNAAIWFWKTSSPNFENISEDLDVQRSAAYCQRFKLLPSESPHILITSTHPDEEARMNALSEQYFVARLNGLDTEETQELVGALADGISTGELQQEDINSRRFWLGLQNVVSNAVSDLGEWVECVSFKIDARFVKLEIIGGNPADDRPECPSG